MGKKGCGHLYQKRGHGNWRVRWMFDGKLHDESTGTDDYEKAQKIAHQKTGCTQALGDVRALTARLEKAKDEQAVLEAKTNPSLNLFDMVAAYKSCDVVRRKNRSFATQESWVSYGNLLIDYFGGKTELRQITSEQAEKFFREYEAKVSPSSFNKLLSFVKMVWKTLYLNNPPNHNKARLPEHSPFEKILAIEKATVHGKQPFTEEQLIKIWRVLDEMKKPDLKLLFDMARNTGARLHDLVSWKWDENIKFISDEEVIVDWHQKKTGKHTVLPILDKRVIKDLYIRYKDRKVGEEFYLPHYLELYDNSHASALIDLTRKVFKKAGLTTSKKFEGNKQANCIYGMHSFRHTLVSELFRKGVDLATIQHLYAGHGSSFITELYAHADMEQKINDLSKLSKIDTSPKEPDGFQTFIGQLNEADKVEYDKIKLMDIPKRIQNELISLLKFKSKDEIKIIRDWLTARL